MGTASNMETIASKQMYFEATFDKQTLASLDVYGAEFEACDFNHCDFSSTAFEHCKFIDCTFKNCNLSLLKVPYSRFTEVEFIECKLVGIDWTRADWPSFTLGSELKFRRCILNDSSFFGLTLNELTFDSCKLHEVDMREGDFAKSIMTDCDFSNSLFMRTNLEQVDFTDSRNFTLDVLSNRLSKAKFSRYEALSLLEGLGVELV